MSEIETILETEYPYQLFEKILYRIWEAKCESFEPFESYSTRLTEGERIVILLSAFMDDYTNGNWSQYLTNPDGRFAEQTRLALRQIGAIAAADALDDVRHTIFGDAP
jgi:hypothetical protein